MSELHSYALTLNTLWSYKISYGKCKFDEGKNFLTKEADLLGKFHVIFKNKFRHMKKIIMVLSSPIIMGVLFIMLAFAMGVATFIENDFGSRAAKAIVYNAWWFEFMFALLAINMVLRLCKSVYWTKEKISVTVFHMAFLIILAGATITRYVGFEGMMHIREGESSNHFYSADHYVWGYIEKGQERMHFEQKVFMSAKSQDHFKMHFDQKGVKVGMISTSFLENVTRVPIPSNDGNGVISLVISSKGNTEKVHLAEGDIFVMNQFKIGFCSADSVDFNINYENNCLIYRSSFAVKVKSRQEVGDSISNYGEFIANELYNVSDVNIVPLKIFPHAVFYAESTLPEKGIEAITMSIEVDDVQKELTLFKLPEGLNTATSISVGDVKVVLNYGLKRISLPFQVQLNDFLLERYPGSESPSSFVSDVTVIDEEEGVNKQYQIFMNNILNYRGYRLYQSSYDRDEKGTVLSVNKDLWGTRITYLGYGILALFMVLSLLASKSRFKLLAQKLKAINKSILLLFVFTGFGVFQLNAQVDKAIVVSEAQAAQFGKLWVQDQGGRMKPVNTLSNEVLRKLVKHNSFKGYKADRVFLSMLLQPEIWESIPLITVKNKTIKEAINCSGKKATYADFFDDDGHYKLAQWVGIAYRTMPSSQDKFQKELIKVDEQVNVFYLVSSFELLHLFPSENDVSDLWLTPVDTKENRTTGQMAMQNDFKSYLNDLRTGEYEKADKLIEEIQKAQKKVAQEILPSELTKAVEIFYNETNIFMFLAPVVFLLGIIMLMVHFVYLLLPYSIPVYLSKTTNVIMVFIFAIYTLGLLLRWFVAKHAPWSNGYESMLYVGWSVVLAGLFFSRRNSIVLSISSAFAGIVLFVAHLSWMNPEITPLVPVLKSYWLTIHVAVIVGSYGFLTLGALISFINLVLMGVQKVEGDIKVVNTIKELSYVSEMSLMIGTYALTVGSFIGGIWANESWGRYWGWDPKETWSMITILIYAFVLHMRMIPSLKGLVSFNIGSVLAFGSVLMTYLGVNYYLTGMHSYGKGDSVPAIGWVYYIVITVAVVIVYAIINQRRVKK